MYSDNEKRCGRPYYIENNYAEKCKEEHKIICSDGTVKGMDKGGMPYVTNVMQDAIKNNNFRTALWSGKNLQMTLMCIPVHGDIGIEMHGDTDQAIRVEAGTGMVRMGSNKNKMDLQRKICVGDVVFVPAGTWHNIVNIDDCHLKLSSIYAPPNHPKGTVHRTKEEAERAENHGY